MAPAPALLAKRAAGRLRVLVALSSCLTGALAGCYDFTFDEPGPVGDAAMPEAGDAGGRDAADTCTVNVESCGGDGLRGDPDTLYRCLVDGGGSLVKKCASGCVRDAGTGAGGRCVMPATPCKVGGFYCGGDKLDGDPAVLYTCGTGGTAVEKERCTKGCQVAKSGLDDACVK
jgi:hypothetical protein